MTSTLTFKPTENKILSNAPSLLPGGPGGTRSGGVSSSSLLNFSSVLSTANKSSTQPGSSSLLGKTSTSSLLTGPSTLRSSLLANTPSCLSTRPQTSLLGHSTMTSSLLSSRPQSSLLTQSTLKPTAQGQSTSKQSYLTQSSLGHSTTTTSLLKSNKPLTTLGSSQPMKTLTGLSHTSTTLGSSLIGRGTSSCLPMTSSTLGRSMQQKSVTIGQPYEEDDEESEKCFGTVKEVVDFAIECNDFQVVRPSINRYVTETESKDDDSDDDDEIDPNRAEKLAFINLISGSLIKGPNFKNPLDATRIKVMNASKKIASLEPEFLLKVALYCRRELNIRTTTNFLLALAAFTESCRPFLKKYFVISINLPSDWIEVAELYQSFHDKTIKWGALPSALRKVMVSKFPAFDEYQLAKYNKDKKKSADKGKKKGDPKKKEAAPKIDLGDNSDSEDEKELESKTFTLKQLIRQLHINTPVSLVLALLGHKYPEDPEAFKKTGMEGIFDSERAGKRMKLAVPETWETQVSARGNKPEVWQDLIDHRKLPYMAMLRNIRNMIRAGISDKHHTFVIKKIQDEGAVMNSKMFPFRFFSAYQILDELEEDIKKKEEEMEKAALQPSVEKSFKKSKKGVKSVGRGGGKTAGRGAARGGGRGGSTGGVAQGWTEKATTKDGKKVISPELLAKIKEAKAKARREKPLMYDETLLKRYRLSLDNAIKVATIQNLPPIKGKTLILCSTSAHAPCPTFKGMGTPRSTNQVAALMSLMCQFACESADIYVLPSANSYFSLPPLDHKKGILTQMADVITPTESCDIQVSTTAAECQIFEKIIVQQQKYDTILMVGLTDELAQDMYLPIYREIVNPETMIVSVDLNGKMTDVKENTTSPVQRPSRIAFHRETNWISISGFSDQLLRFIAERGDSSLLHRVQTIDERFGLYVMPFNGKDASQLPNFVSEYNTNIFRLMQKRQSSKNRFRVFISSTFLDMHGERDVLTRLVMPELRSVCKEAWNVEVEEVDLRWGVTEKETANGQALELCLKEAARADLFVGLIGERYGWIPDASLVHALPPDLTHGLSSEGLSVTEMEYQVATKSMEERGLTGRIFFYLRDSKVIQSIPANLLNQFVENNEQTKEKLKAFKKTIYKAGLLADTYPSYFSDVVDDDKAIVGGLERFANHVLNSLWNAIVQIKTESGKDDDDNEMYGKDLMQDILASMVKFESDVSSSLRGRKKELSEMKKQIDVELKRLGAILEKRDIQEKEDAKRHQPSVKMPTVATPAPSVGRGGILLVSGPPGSGKTSLMAAFASQCRSDNPRALIIYHVVGACPRSDSLECILRSFLCHMSVPLYLSDENAKFTDFKSTELSDLVSQFHKRLVEYSQVGVKVVVVIDGADIMDNAGNARSMDWIPQAIPGTVRFVISAVTGGEVCKIIANRPDCVSMSIDNLPLLDRAEIIRRILTKHGKTLTEGSTNNQMTMLTTKKDSGLPLYLSLACEELKLFGVYEKVSSKLKSLPPKLPQLISHILDRVEDEMDTELVTTILGLLLCSKSDLSISDLHGLLNARFSIFCSNDFVPVDMESAKSATACVLQESNYNPEKWENVVAMAVPKMVLKRFLASLNGIIVTTELRQDDGSPEMVRLGNIETTKEIRSRYLPRSQGTSNLEISMHRMMAARWLLLSDPDRDWTFSGNHAPAFINLVYHLFHGGCWQELESTLSSLYFVSKKLALGLGDSLTQDYAGFTSGNKAFLQDWEKMRTSANVQDYASFVARNLPFLKAHPSLTLQQALNETPSRAPHRDTLEILSCPLKSKKNAIGNVIQRITSAADDDAIDTCVTIDTSANQPITCVAFSADGYWVACGTDKGTVRILESATLQEHRTLLGHSSKITSLCFLSGTAPLLASVSSDDTGIVWSVTGGHRVFSLSKHNRGVTCCASNPRGELLVTAGLDGMVNLYQRAERESIKKQHTFRTGRSLNCVTFHPEGVKIATGGWDNTVRMFNCVDHKMIAVNRKHSSAVRALAFSRDGLHLASGTIDGEVFLWHSDTGTFVGVVRTGGPSIRGVEYSMTGEDLVVVDESARLGVWAGCLGVERFCEKVSSGSGASSLAVEEDNNVIAIGSHSGNLEVFSTITGESLASIGAHKARVRGVEWVPTVNSSLYLASASEDTSLQVHSFKSSKLKLECKVNVGSPVLCVSSSPAFIAFGCEDCSVYIKAIQNSVPSAPDGDHRNDRVSVHSGAILDIAIDDTGMYAATASKDMSIAVIALHDRQVLVHHSQAHADWVTALSWRQMLGRPSGPGEGCLLVTGSNDLTLKLWRLNTVLGKASIVETCVMKGHKGAVTSVDFKVGSIVSGSSTGEACLWSTGGHLITTLYNTKDSLTKVNDLALTIDRNFISEAVEEVTVPENTDGLTWAEMEERQDAMKASKARLKTSCSSLAVLAQLMRVTIATEAGWVSVHNPLLPNRRPPLTGHSDHVTGLANGINRRVVSGGLDGSVRMWKLPCYSPDDNVHLVHNGPVTCSVSPRPRFPYIATGSSDGSVILWDPITPGCPHVRLTILPTKQHKILPIVHMVLAEEYKDQPPTLALLCTQFVYLVKPVAWDKFPRGKSIEMSSIGLSIIQLPQLTFQLATTKVKEEIIIAPFVSKDSGQFGWFNVRRKKVEWIRPIEGESSVFSCCHLRPIKSGHVLCVNFASATLYKMNVVNHQGKTTDLSLELYQTPITCDIITETHELVILAVGEDGLVSVNRFDSTGDIYNVVRTLSAACFISGGMNDFYFATGSPQGHIEVWNVKSKTLHKMAMYSVSAKPVHLKGENITVNGERKKCLIVGDEQGSVSFLLLHFITL